MFESLTINECGRREEGCMALILTRAQRSNVSYGFFGSQPARGSTEGGM